MMSKFAIKNVNGVDFFNLDGRQLVEATPDNCLRLLKTMEEVVEAKSAGVPLESEFPISKSAFTLIKAISNDVSDAPMVSVESLKRIDPVSQLYLANDLALAHTKMLDDTVTLLKSGASVMEVVEALRSKASSIQQQQMHLVKKSTEVIVEHEHQKALREVETKSKLLDSKELLLKDETRKHAAMVNAALTIKG